MCFYYLIGAVMQELNMVEVEEVGGGLAFLPMLAASAVGGAIGGYVYGKVEQLFK
jgi:hypothetical protein